MFALFNSVLVDLPLEVRNRELGRLSNSTLKLLSPMLGHVEIMRFRFRCPLVLVCLYELVLIILLCLSFPTLLVSVFSQPPLPQR